MRRIQQRLVHSVGMGIAAPQHIPVSHKPYAVQTKPYTGATLFHLYMGTWEVILN